MMSELYGFEIKRSVSLEWMKEEVSTEGIRDTLKDLFTSKLNKSELDSISKEIDIISTLAGSNIKTDNEILLFKETQSAMKFLTKNGSVISSLPYELERQIDNINKLNKAINTFMRQISKLDVNASEYEALEELNDSELMDVFNSVSRLSFLDSIYINYVANKTIDNIQLQFEKKLKKIDISKKSPILHFLKGSFGGGYMKSIVPIAALTQLRKVIKIPALWALYAVGATLVVKTINSLDKAKAAYRNAQDHNKEVEKLIFKIIDASAIKANDFNILMNKLNSASKELLKTINEFYKLDSIYKESNNSLIRDMLRNSRTLSVVGCKVLESQNKFFKEVSSEVR